MAGIEAVSATGGSSAADRKSGAGGDDGDNAKVQDAFEQGIMHFMMTQLESAQNDVTQACQDDTSDPDDPAA